MEITRELNKEFPMYFYIVYIYIVVATTYHKDKWSHKLL